MNQISFNAGHMNVEVAFEWHHINNKIPKTYVLNLNKITRHESWVIFGPT